MARGDVDDADPETEETVIALLLNLTLLAPVVRPCTSNPEGKVVGNVGDICVIDGPPIDARIYVKTEGEGTMTGWSLLVSPNIATTVVRTPTQGDQTLALLIVFLVIFVLVCLAVGALELVRIRKLLEAIHFEDSGPPTVKEG